MKKYYIVCAALLILTTGCFESKKTNSSEAKVNNNVTSNIEESTETNNYILYLNFGATLKISYQQTCTKKDTVITCKEPIVTNVELINDKAKSLFKDTNFLSGQNDLAAVLNSIYTISESKGSKVSNVSMQSDWSGLSNYLTTSANKNTTYKKVTFAVSNVKSEQINTNINNDLSNEAKAKAEAEAKAKKEAEAKAKAEAEAKKKAEEAAKKKAQEEAKKKAEEEAKKKAEAEKKAVTIYLKDNVKYDFNEAAYQCKKNGCFSNSLINQLKSAKGHYVVKANNNEITIRTITKLSGKYNTSGYRGTDLSSKITSAGGENVGGLGSSEEPLTKTICNQYHLICE